MGVKERVVAGVVAIGTAVTAGIGTAVTSGAESLNNVNNEPVSTPDPIVQTFDARIKTPHDYIEEQLQRAGWGIIQDGIEAAGEAIIKGKETAEEAEELDSALRKPEQGASPEPEGGQTAAGGSAISTAELVVKVNEIRRTSEKLSAMTGSASRDLMKSASTLAALTHESRSGEEATGTVRTASGSLNKASLSLKALCRSCDEFIRNAVK
jgi:hypothetical protein